MIYFHATRVEDKSLINVTGIASVAINKIETVLSPQT